MRSNLGKCPHGHVAKLLFNFESLTTNVGYMLHFNRFRAEGSHELKFGEMPSWTCHMWLFC